MLDVVLFLNFSKFSDSHVLAIFLRFRVACFHSVLCSLFPFFILLFFFISSFLLGFNIDSLARVQSMPFMYNISYSNIEIYLDVSKHKLTITVSK